MLIVTWTELWRTDYHNDSKFSFHFSAFLIACSALVRIESSFLSKS